ncbi:MAG: hypothetical protein IT285_15805 [Bdellovibrionales bacterium]|nr:hypothetical protein [Bdellovibrionales bacterium]
MDRKTRSAWLPFALLGALHAAPPSAWAEPPGEYPPPAQGNLGGGLGDFFQLNEALPQAVCDKAAVSRAPTLESTRAGALAGGAGGPARARRDTLIPLRDFSFRLAVPEPHLIRFLMEDPRVLLAQPRLLDLWQGAQGQGAESLAGLKRAISLEVCTAQVTPGKVQALLERKPDLFLRLDTDGAGKGARAVEQEDDRAQVVVRDVEDRFGVVRGKWWAAGWVEPFEVRAITLGRRSYRRLAHPITNQLRLIQVESSDGLPLGFIYLSPEGAAPAVEWAALRAQAESPANRRKRIESYLLQVETAAYEALARSPARTEGIRDLQEFTKSLLNAYQIFPNDPRFAAYGGKAPTSKAKPPGAAPKPPDSGVEQVLDERFFEALRSAEVGGAQVTFSYFRPDARLHAIFREYLTRLEALERGGGTAGPQ